MKLNDYRNDNSWREISVWWKIGDSLRSVERFELKILTQTAAMQQHSWLRFTQFAPQKLLVVGTWWHHFSVEVKVGKS